VIVIMPKPPVRSHFLDLLDRYDAILLDAYGVLVNLDGALPGAAGWIDELNRRGKPYWLVSNTAARLPESAAVRYQGFGLAIPAEHILSSGMLLTPYFARHDLVGRRIRLLGPADSVRYAELAGGVVVDAGEDFDALVVADQAGFDFVAAVDEVLSRLFMKIDAGQSAPLILPNPDLVYPTAQGCGITSGAVALMIEAALQRRYPDRTDLRFVGLGKPHPDLFEEAIRRVGSRNVLMVGDQLETDILGANRVGIDSALVPGGITGNRYGSADARPTYVLALPDED
jgi:HAD superfamily hydrolase (TIGR01459 family)